MKSMVRGPICWDQVYATTRGVWQAPLSPWLPLSTTSSVQVLVSTSVLVYYKWVFLVVTPCFLSQCTFTVCTASVYHWCILGCYFLLIAPSGQTLLAATKQKISKSLEKRRCWNVGEKETPMFTEANVAVSGTRPQMGLLGLTTVWVNFGLEQVGLSIFAPPSNQDPRFRLLEC